MPCEAAWMLRLKHTLEVKDEIFQFIALFK